MRRLRGIRRWKSIASTDHTGRVGRTQPRSMECRRTRVGQPTRPLRKERFQILSNRERLPTYRGEIENDTVRSQSSDPQSNEKENAIQSTFWGWTGMERPRGQPDITADGKTLSETNCQVGKVAQGQDSQVWKKLQRQLRHPLNVWRNVQPNAPQEERETAKGRLPHCA